MVKNGIVDADLLGKTRHQFPNLALMKISGYKKSKSQETELVLDYKDLHKFNNLYVSKVFTDTPYPSELFNKSNTKRGGTGFGSKEVLPEEIEHTMPDYHLYDKWLENKKLPRISKSIFTDSSIGYLTRGCPRGCSFCVNQNSKGTHKASELKEFLDNDRKYIVLLDDNFLAYKNHYNELEKLINTGKPFTFKQGLDVRLINDLNLELLFNAKYWGDYIFAFDDISEYNMVNEKLKLIRNHTDTKNIKFYLLTGYKGTGVQDIIELFERINLLKEFNCLPYVMRYKGVNGEPYKKSEYKGLYIAVARWCNQPAFFRTMTFREFCEKDNETRKPKKGECASMRALNYFEEKNPDIARKYFG